MKFSCARSEDHDRGNARVAVETLINCAEGRDFLIHARIAVPRAPAPEEPPRRKTVKQGSRERAAAERVLGVRRPRGLGALE